MLPPVVILLIVASADGEVSHGPESSSESETRGASQAKFQTKQETKDVEPPVEFATEKEFDEFDWSTADLAKYPETTSSGIKKDSCYDIVEVWKNIPIKITSNGKFFTLSLKVEQMNAGVQTVMTSYPGNITHTTVQMTSINCLEPDDQKILDHLTQHYMFPAPTKPYPAYNFTKTPKLHGEWGSGIPDIILALFQGFLNSGFFIEAGAVDGEQISNTLLLEMSGWTGALVEFWPPFFLSGLKKNRHATWITTCLSPEKRPKVFKFGLPKNMENKVDHLSLGILDGNPTVHYLSLDIEGAEFDVLDTIPFDKVDIWTLSVEALVYPEKRSAIHKLLRNNGYIYIGTAELDDIFVKKWFLMQSPNKLTSSNYYSTLTKKENIDMTLFLIQANPDINIDFNFGKAEVGGKAKEVDVEVKECFLNMNNAESTMCKCDQMRHWQQEEKDFCYAYSRRLRIVIKAKKQ